MRPAAALEFPSQKSLARPAAAPARPITRQGVRSGSVHYAACAMWPLSLLSSTVSPCGCRPSWVRRRCRCPPSLSGWRRTCRPHPRSTRPSPSSACLYTSLYRLCTAKNIAQLTVASSVWCLNNLRIIQNFMPYVQAQRAQPQRARLLRHRHRGVAAATRRRTGAAGQAQPRHRGRAGALHCCTCPVSASARLVLLGRKELLSTCCKLAAGHKVSHLSSKFDNWLLTSALHYCAVQHAHQRPDQADQRARAAAHLPARLQPIACTLHQRPHRLPGDNRHNCSRL